MKYILNIFNNTMTKLKIRIFISTYLVTLPRLKAPSLWYSNSTLLTEIAENNYNLQYLKILII